MAGSLVRSRWAALGAAVAVSLGGGAVWMVQAAGGASPATSLVAIAPCRLMDTRPSPLTVGPRSTPIGAAQTYTATVWGTNGECTIPASALAVSLNVTAVFPTAPSFLTVFPADEARPTASNLNYASGQVVPNAVTVKLSADGKVSFYNQAGSVNVIADVVGYYTATAASGGPANLGYAATVVDTTGNPGYYASMTIGTDGLPIISHYDTGNGNLRVAHCNDTTCTSVTKGAIDSAGDVGSYSSLAIGTDGLAIISYYDATNGDLKVAHCDDVACSGATRTAIATTGDVGMSTSIAIGTDGLPIISYADVTNDTVRVAHCADVACTSATSAQIEVTSDPMSGTSIAVGADGLPVVSLMSTSGLRVVHCDSAVCSVSSSTVVDNTGGEGGWYSSIAIGVDGLPVVSQHDGENLDLKVTHCSNVDCTSGTTTVLDESGNVGSLTALAIGSDGLPVVSYFDAPSDRIKVAHCSNTTCSVFSLTTADSVGVAGFNTTLTIGVDGMPIFAYADATNTGLRVVHCSNTFCTPNVRAR